METGLLLAGVGVLLGGCGGTPAPGVLDPPPSVPEPDPARVEAVVFLVGDAGDAPVGGAPVAHALGEEVEAVSAEAGPEASVDVLYLGDNVYPVGVRADGPREAFVADSLRLRSQVDAVAGPRARDRGVRGWFLAGNHDWGSLPGEAGLARLRHQAHLLRDLSAETGARVSLVPGPGRPGPVVEDLGARLRLVLLDTHWWLQSHDDTAKARVLDEVEAALRTAGEREVVMAAHHPFQSGGPHVADVPLSRGLGLVWLLRRTGALVQDVNSAPYAEIGEGLAEAYRRAGRPLAFAAGHDHSLQVLALDDPGQPRWSLVSGAGSKLTGVSTVPGLEMGISRPGYMRITVVDDGTVLLHVRATDGPPVCPARAGSCMAPAVAGFETVYARVLREPEDNAGAPETFRGSGHEPGWLVEIDDSLTLLTDYGRNRTVVPTPEPRTLPDGRAYRVETERGPVTVRITDTPCSDAATGMPHPATVRLEEDGQTLRGCGGDPTTLLRGPTWEVTTLAGQEPSADATPSLDFGPDRVSGDASCNRYSAPYTITGEGLRIGSPELATTTRACPDQLEAQETRFLELLAAVWRFARGPGGTLVLHAEGGDSITARRP
jgi:heat shock protein HslJ